MALKGSPEGRRMFLGSDGSARPSQIVIRETDLAGLSWLTDLTESGWIVVLSSRSAFAGRERVLSYLTVYPRYVRAVLASLLHRGDVLWFT